MAPRQNSERLNGRSLLANLTTGLNLLGSALILVLMILIGLDVAGRNFFAAPISGVPEIVTLSILVIVFLQAPNALMEGLLTRSDTILLAVSKRWPMLGKAIETIFDLVGIMVFAIVTLGTWPLFQKAWQRNEFIGAIGDFTAPVWPVKVAILIGSALLAAHFLRRILVRWRIFP